MRILVDMQGTQSSDHDSGMSKYLTLFFKALIDNHAEHEIYILLNAFLPDSADVIQNELSSLLPEDHTIIFHAVGPVNEFDPNNEWNRKVSELIREKMIDDIAPDFTIITSFFIGFNDNSIVSIGNYSNNVPTAVILYDRVPCVNHDKTPVTQLKQKWYERKIKSIRQADLILVLSLDTIDSAVKLLEKVHSQNNRITLQRDIYRSTSFLLDLIAEIKYTKIPSENDLIKVVEAIEENEKISSKLLRHSAADTMLRWRVEGPFDSSYSLAIVNSEIAVALKTLGHDVALYSTDGRGDFSPNKLFLEKNSDINKLHQRSLTLHQGNVDITSRNMYPPRVNDMHTQVNILHNYAWEETEFPKEWVTSFNRSLHGLALVTDYVKKVMIDNGVVAPLSVTGNGVDHWERICPDTNYRISAKGFRFLHVSTCLPRKGVDVLLKAYSQVFSEKENVSLIIKTVPNAHKDLQRWIDEARQTTEDFPDLIIIEDDLTPEQLKALYEQCHTLVGPSRAEGFGLPFAEAMLSSLPVIVTDWGGQLDFCNKKTAWLIDYAFKPAKTHFELYNSVWAEPSQKHMGQLMRQVYELPEVKRKERSKYGREVLLENFKWIDVAQRLVDSAKIFSKTTPVKPPKIGWITTWNVKCSIASYSEYLIAAMDHDVTILASHTTQSIKQDCSNVYRCWDTGNSSNLDDLTQTIDKLKLEVIVIQFNYSLFNFDRLNDFIVKQADQGRTVVMVMHATADLKITPYKQLKSLLPGMKASSRLLVHTYHDLNRLKNYSLVNNVALFPHGVFDWETDQKEKNDSFILATYGFALPYKGLIELIAAVKVLLDRGLNVKLKMINAEHPTPQSSNLIKEIKEHIEVEGLTQYIELISDFLSDEESLTLLSSSDLIIFPYQETEKSNSCSVRHGLASGRPVTVTPLTIFDDIEQAVFSLPGSQVKEMAEGISNIIYEIKNNSKIVQKKNIAAKKWCDSHQYSAIGERLSHMLTALYQQIK